MVQYNPSKLILQRVGNVTIIEFTSVSMLDQMSIESVRLELNQLVEKTAVPKFIVSFETVTMVSSAILGILIALQKFAKIKGGEVRVIHVSPALQQVFQLTKIDKMIKICKNLDDAMVKI